MLPGICGVGRPHVDRRAADSIIAASASAAGSSLLSHATADLATVMESWGRWLGTERRLAARTLQGYHEDMASFVGFLGGHLGGDVSLTDLATLRLADLR